jgi:hypothetical protein
MQWNGTAMASGLSLRALNLGSFVQTKKMLLTE